jgi:hypothetical protein
MGKELRKTVRAIHDLEKALRLWELLRDNAQQVVDEHGGSAEVDPRVTKALVYIARCDSAIRALAARIEEIEIRDGDWRGSTFM